MEELPKSLQELKDAVTQLKALLDDPQPGLISWVSMVHDRWEEVVDLYNKY